ncbi:MAG: tRNA uridine-5-carboxymethylaminomethyl(34) synthesis GTPase MnmE [Thermoleophilia bacterium]|nr:tRNA uridine-5-carboxymethylaminomethyl(34) synthesis GTPase MnmE [Thermoleophilia bacterium]
MSATSDTIAAISTALGPGAIGIVRMSGPQAIAIAEKVFRPATRRTLGPADTFCLVYGHVIDPCAGEVVDEVLLAVMRAPRSYTREDVVEFHCHGGVAAQRSVLRVVLAQGARLAQPGEFTKRAFLNGRIDLAQAESVAAIVGARSSAALRAALRQLEGGLSGRVREIRARLIGVLARIEATLDFSDEDVEDVDWAQTASELEAASGKLHELLKTAFLGRALEQGVRTAIVGRPNVGKSSLLNALLARERAIVSDIPGTTRDTVEEGMEIGGIPIQLVDTAGIRKSNDLVEQLGVARSLKAIDHADLVLAVVDLSAPWSEDDREVLAATDPCRTIVVGNKRDLLSARKDEELVETLKRQAEAVRHGGWRVCVVSALTGAGLDRLRAMVEETVLGVEGISLEEPVLAAERHRVLVAEAQEAVEAALSGVRQGRPEELICEDVRAAAGALGQITGEDLTADLIDEIFSRFCLGK